MINPRELRIGNILRQGIVTELNQHWITLHTGSIYHPDDIDPLPLNQNILTDQFDFEYDGVAYCKLDFVIFDYYSGLAYSPTGSLAHPGTLTELKNVHELQNLYFAVHKKEITHE